MKTTSFRSGITVICAFIASFVLYGCQKNVLTQDKHAAGFNALQLFLTDDPSPVAEQLWLDIQQLEIKVEDDDQARHESEHQQQTDDDDNKGNVSGGWMNINIRRGVYNILQFRNGLDTLLGGISFPAAHALKKVRLRLGNNNTAVVNGTAIPLIVKDNDHYIVIRLETAAISLNSGNPSKIWIDIDAGRSISRHGNDLELKPRATCFSKESTGRLQGTVLPKEAHAMVIAFNASDTATSKPEDSGAFSFSGLKPAVYSVKFIATTGNYRDTTLQNIVVKLKEDTKLTPVILHP